MKKFILLLTAFALLQGCAGVSEKIVYTDGGQAYKMEEVYSIGLFTPTYQFKRASACDVEEKLINTTKHGSGYTVRSVTNCKLIGGADGFTPDLAGPIGPMILQAGGSVAQGVLIKEGLDDSGDSISNTNQQGQLQGQAQGQISGGGCRGNCGGGPR